MEMTDAVITTQPIPPLARRLRIETLRQTIQAARQERQDIEEEIAWMEHELRQLRLEENWQHDD